MKLGKLEINLRILWYDFWIGFYYDRKDKILYFCPIPMIVFRFQKTN
jgi:hypothetical protein